MPPAATKSKYGKYSKSYFFTPPQPQGHVMSVKCGDSIDELTVQVWLLYHHPNFKYCTLFVSGTELRRNGQTNGRTDRRTIRLLDAPADLSGRGHKKSTQSNIQYQSIGFGLVCCKLTSHSAKFHRDLPSFRIKTFCRA